VNARSRMIGIGLVNEQRTDRTTLGSQIRKDVRGAHVTAIGPLGLEYLSAKDDPRNNNS
jgi:hypothetical protein